MFILDELFCSVDDFCLKFEPQWEKQLMETDQNVRICEHRLCLSTLSTILIAFDTSP